MRDYARVSPRTWTGDTGRKLRGRKDERILFDYLVTCPTSTMIGLFYLPFPVIAHETGLTEGEVRCALNWLSAEGVAHYDHNQELMWVPNMAFWQVAETLKPSDNNVTRIKRELVTFRGHPFAREFVRLYDGPFSLGIGDDQVAIDRATGAPPLSAPRVQQALPGQSATPSKGPTEALKPVNDSPQVGHASGSGSGTSAGTGAGASGARARNGPVIWMPTEWLRRYKLAWENHELYSGRFYGDTGDAVACGKLTDELAKLPPDEQIAAQVRSTEMFAEFLGRTEPKLIQRRHPWNFFVQEFGGLRVPVAAARGSPDPPWVQSQREQEKRKGDESARVAAARQRMEQLERESG